MRESNLLTRSVQHGSLPLVLASRVRLALNTAELAVEVLAVAASGPGPLQSSPVAAAASPVAVVPVMATATTVASAQAPGASTQVPGAEEQGEIEGSSAVNGGGGPCTHFLVLDLSR